uniref:Uncharacterized protein n=1 Tax=Romanomermis culicivorax TaxID=13658 RepID=A0A915JGH2_ROMCU
MSGQEKSLSRVSRASSIRRRSRSSNTSPHPIDGISSPAATLTVKDRIKESAELLDAVTQMSYAQIHVGGASEK